MTRANIPAIACLSCLAGIFLDSFVFFRQLSPVFLLLASIPAAVLVARKKLVFIAVICLVFTTAGIVRHRTYLNGADGNPVNKFSGSSNPVTVLGTIAEDPANNKDRQKLIIGVDKIVYEDKTVEIKNARIVVSLYRYPQYHYGDRLKLTGLIVAPPVFSDFNYRDYLKAEGVYALMYWPKVELVGINTGNIVKKTLYQITGRFREDLLQIMSPPQSALMMGLMFGDDSGFSEAWQDRFNITATRHITAVSGMNITLISFIILDFMLYLGLYRRHALIIAAIVVVLYVLMVGAPASAIRAGIMAIFMFVAQLSGRYARPIRPLLFAAVIMAIINPLILKSDSGFQLSFLAMLGLIYFEPFISDRFKKLPNILSLRTTLSATLSAQIFTLPVIVYNFGRLSLIGPVSNILIVPMVPILTIIGFITVFISMISLAVGQVASWLAWLFSSYILTAVRLMASLPLASVNIINTPPWVLAVCYLIIGYFAWRLRKNEQLKFLGG